MTVDIKPGTAVYKHFGLVAIVLSIALMTVFVVIQNTYHIASNFRGLKFL